MTYFAINLVMILALGFCVWQGYRKGIFLSLISMLVLIIAAGAAGRIAAGYGLALSEKLQPVLGWTADEAIDYAALGKGDIDQITDSAVINEIIRNSFKKAGVPESKIKKMTDRTLKEMRNDGKTIREAISGTLLYATANMMTGFFAFIIMTLLMTLLLYFIASIFKLPTFPAYDKYGGPACGLVYGILILGAVAWAVRYAGFFVSEELVEKTFMLSLFSKISILGAVLSF